jgi:hypothetical protein
VQAGLQVPGLPLGQRGLMADDNTIKRINVTVSPATVEALQRMVIREGVSLAEAVRRLVAYGDMVANVIDVDGDKLLIERRDGKTSEIITLR